MEPPSRHSVAVLDESGRGEATDPIARAVGAALDLMAVPASDVRVLLTSDERVRDLNARFRGRDEATDVLTFPEGEAASGDIAIAVPYASRQAAVRGVTLGEELAYLAIHGALHLAGLDDETEGERAAMVARMNDVARAVGLPPDEAWGSLLHPAEVA